MMSSSAVARAASSVSSAVFISLADCKREKLPLVTKVFSETFDPFYGPQPAVLKDIEERLERKTEILSHENSDIGCIIYRRDLTDALASEGIPECLEVTLMALFNPENDASKGY